MLNKRILALTALLLPFAAGAQTLDYTRAETVGDFGGRFAVAADYSLIPRQLKLSAEQEFRLTDSFGTFKRSYTTLGLDYKLLPWLKIGAGYSLIANNSASKGWGLRHRGFLTLTESWKFGRLKISLREKLQGTCDGNVNIYQEPETAIALKTRLRFIYDLPHSHFSPFASAEARFLLNGANPGAFVYTTSTQLWSNPDPEYSDIYFNRLRFNLGTHYKLPDKNVLDFFVIADLCYDLDIDFNSKGVQKSVENDDGDITARKDYLFLQDSYFFGIGVKYTFKL